ncbi:hypothetical protein B5S28_g2549 [[Candida] boidinii]|nr:hypothetical protein B5S28_g2549 [[Candida] boidinii]OWB63513.1 hypothetical protein B5S29_g4497 [[Candida] boidinii]OWB74487.1 hypothetical protein B5S31_g4283 [[Candida] boidinii]OWB78699.1 hypothetical protein B5S32_g2899 [[Candida] boidinii]
MSAASSKRLWKEFRDITNPKTGLKSVHVELDNDNIFLWKVAIVVINPDSKYNGAFFKGQIKFPSNYPFSPPNFKFTPSIYHPNVYTDGRLCISILHESGAEMTDEPDNETWTPAQSVESVLISIISLLEDPNINSPANVEAAIAYRKNREDYDKRIKSEVERSKTDIPKDFVIPEFNDAQNNKTEDHLDDEEWWDDNYYDDDEEEEDEEEDDDDNEGEFIDEDDE